MLNMVNMTAWVHKECDIMDEEALLKLQEAWDNSERKDEFIVRLDELEWAYWTGTEVGLLGEYEFPADMSSSSTGTELIFSQHSASPVGPL
jgi:hypothetical protein